VSDPTLIAWTLAALLRFAPVAMHEGAPWADATVEDGVARRVGIANAIGSVCSDAKSPRGCASLLVAIAVGESGLARDADVGPCYRVGGYKTRCDSGRAASVWQVQPQGWDADGQPVTVAKLFVDRELAAGIALRVARSSLSRCKSGDPRDRLSGLSGRCIAGPGPWRSRYDLWQRVRAWEPGS